MIKLLTTVEEGILVIVNILLHWNLCIPVAFLIFTPEESREDLLLTDLPIDKIRRGKRIVVQGL